MKTLALMLIASTCLAAEPPAVRDAKREFETRQKWAQEQYEATVKKAKADYVVRLKTALDAALKAKDLDGANAIDAEIKAGAPATTTEEPTNQKDQKLRDMLTGGKWKLEYWHHEIERRAGMRWDFAANGTLNDQGHPNWRINDGTLEVYRVFHKFKYSNGAKRWEAEANKGQPSERETFILPWDGKLPR